MTQMRTTIRMPSFSATMETAKLLAWLVAPGERVAKGQVLAEVETDKAVATLESPGAGRVAEILVQAGDDDLPVHSELAVLEIDSEQAAGRAAGQAPAALAPQAPAPEQRSVASSGSAQPVADAQRRPASPAARALARASGIDLESIVGTGPSGRVVRSDVESHVASLRSASGEASRREAARTSSHEAAEPETGRSAMARALVHAKTTVPHFYAELDIRLDALLEKRSEIQTRGERPPTITAYLIRAAALSLADVPAVNRYWEADRVHRGTRADVGCAVALPENVVVPVIRDADRLSVSGVAEELDRLGSLARQGALRQQDLGGASLTISNLGMYGIDRFYPIVNVPEPLMLGIGRAREIVGVSGRLIGIQTAMTCTASVDHRVLDGAVVGRFLQAFKKFIEDPGQLSG